MVIEGVSFKIRLDIAEEDFLNAASATNTFTGVPNACQVRRQEVKHVVCSR